MLVPCILIGLFLILFAVFVFILAAAYRIGLQFLGVAVRVLCTLEISDIFMKAVGIVEYEAGLSVETVENKELKKEQDKKLIITVVLLQHGYNPRVFNIEGLLSWAIDQYKRKK